MGVNRIKLSILGLPAAAALLAGCSGSQQPAANAHPTATSTTAPSPSTAPTPPSAAPTTSFAGEEASAAAAYARFWVALSKASRATTRERRLGTLLPVTTDPELSQIFTRLGAERRQGKVFYGVDRPRIRQVVVRGQRATVTDCQDSSAAGVMDARTGRKLTVGVPHHPVTATLLKRETGWKVSVVTYPPSGSRC